MKSNTPRMDAAIERGKKESIGYESPKDAVHCKLGVVLAEGRQLERELAEARNVIKQMTQSTSIRAVYVIAARYDNAARPERGEGEKTR